MKTKPEKAKTVTGRIPQKEWNEFYTLMFQHFAISKEKVSDNFLLQCAIGLATQKLQEKIAAEKK